MATVLITTHVVYTVNDYSLVSRCRMLFQSTQCTPMLSSL